MPSSSSSERLVTDKTAKTGRGGSFEQSRGLSSAIGDEPRKDPISNQYEDDRQYRLSECGAFEPPKHEDELDASWPGHLGRDDEGVSFVPWVNGHVRRILASRTQFSFYLNKTILNCRSGRVSARATALFPIPIPYMEVWKQPSQKMNSKMRRSIAYKKILHIAVMALNFEYLGAPLAALELLRREPSTDHFKVFDRLFVLIKASVRSEGISLAQCGRKSFQLDARLEELLSVVNRLGLSSKFSYDMPHHDVEVPLDNSKKEELQPYRTLCAERLKLAGRGLWDCREFISDLFYMAFVEPRCNIFNIEVPDEECPQVWREDPDEVFRLCKVWDANNILRLVPFHCAPRSIKGFSRIFNNYKSVDKDRQIADKRAVNGSEGRIPGPSKQLPQGVHLQQIFPKKFSELLRGAVTDRKDFYHQFGVTDEKSYTNCIWPGFPLSDFEGFEASKRFCGAWIDSKKRGREVEGDHLGVARPSLLVGPDQIVFPAFGALFQGDHLGVEIAITAHEGLLKAFHLLDSSSRLCAQDFIIEDKTVEGLVIDDYFIVSRERVGADPEEASCLEKLRTAKGAYKKHDILGSDDKEVAGETLFKVVGAEVDSRPEIVSQGACILGAPAGKRMALASLTAVAASLPVTSDSLHSSLVGSMVSVLMFRRQMMSILGEVFHVIAPQKLDTKNPSLHPLPRAAAQELAIFSALAPIAVTNLATPVDSRLFATDASSCMGGIACAEVDEELAKLLWRSSDLKGANVPLLSANEAVLAEHDLQYEPTGQGPFAPCAFGPEADEEGQEPCIPRPIGLMYEFLEVCGGAGVVTRDLIELGVVCGPIFDLSLSKQYDITKTRVLEWIIFMMEDGRLKSFLVSPPCTTFSPAAHPCVRSYRVPEGFDRSNEKVKLGNILAFAAMLLLLVALRLRIFGLGEQPRRSKMRWLAQWQVLLLLGAAEVVLASCAYGSEHQKEFVFIGANMEVQLLHRPCTRDHPHVRIEGKFTKPSATYTPGLSRALAKFFRDHLRSRARIEERFEVDVAGLEDAVTTDLSLSLPWKHHSAWAWRGKSHINLLETAATLKLFRDVAKEGGDKRLVYFGDSHVSRSALAKGRTSSFALRHLLKKSSSLCVAYGLYPAGRFAPTRVNPGDHPSRGADIPDPVPRSFVSGASSEALHWILSLPRQRRWASNWVRLVLLAAPWILDFISRPGLRRHARFVVSPEEWRMDFDSSLGYPGEGPAISVAFGLWLGLWILAIFGFQRSLPPLFCPLLLWTSGCCACCLPAAAAPSHVFTESHGDRTRQRARAGITLDEGRRVTEMTKGTRSDLLQSFCAWLESENLIFDEIYMAKQPDLDQINGALVRFGRFLFQAGKPLYHYSETVNAVATKRPILRRSLQQAWDLAALWGSYEPTEHHVAMPFQILLAMLTVCLMWGWKVEAACFALAWGAILRIGEVTAATRADLILPEDVASTADYILIKLLEPKTRFKSARHQAGKLEQPDLIRVISLGFRNLKPQEKLWPMSSAVLRSRFTKVLEKLDLPHKTGQRPKALSLSSFRPGGATWLITMTESAELVRRRGRWSSPKVMEMYLQEVAASTYLNDISQNSKLLIQEAMGFFLECLSAVESYEANYFPPSAWNFLFQQGGLAATQV